MPSGAKPQRKRSRAAKRVLPGQRRKPDARSRVTNGHDVLPNVDGRSEIARRYFDISSAISQFEASELDALMIVDAVPLPAIADLAKRKPITLLPVEGEKIADLRRDFDFLSVDVIPADSYAGVGTTTTLGLGVLWLVADSQDEALVYSLTKSLWNKANRKLLDESGALGRQVKPGSALQAILKAEQECKSTGYPDEAIARRLCLALARSAQSARQRR